jgi:hypothetical protein
VNSPGPPGQMERISLREIVHHDHQNSEGEQYTEPKWGADKQTRVHLPVCLPLARAFNLRAAGRRPMHSESASIAARRNIISSTVKAATTWKKSSRAGPQEGAVARSRQPPPRTGASIAQPGHDRSIERGSPLSHGPSRQIPPGSISHCRLTTSMRWSKVAANTGVGT